MKLLISHQMRLGVVAEYLPFVVDQHRRIFHDAGSGGPHDRRHQMDAQFPGQRLHTADGRPV